MIEALLDDVLELRAGVGPGIVTALARHRGRSLGVIANNPVHLGGAIDADCGADKAARFMQLCDAFALPVLFLCDTPGFMVGPESEKDRHGAPLRPGVFLTGANMPGPDRDDRVAQGVRARSPGDGRRRLQGWGSSGRRPGRPRSSARWAWKGAVRLGMRSASSRRSRIPTSASRPSPGRPVAAAYERGQGINMAAYFEIDDVIDPADSDRWIDTLFGPDSGQWWASPGKRRPNIDAW